jgi:pimeloyl-ACP methyl ester carboxylesterase
MVAAALVLPMLGLVPRALASEPTVPEAPLFHPGDNAGTLTVAPGPNTTPSVHRADGTLAGWVGTASNYGGTGVYSRGEYIYTDHLFDAYGADDGRDAQRDQIVDPLAQAAPDTYRLEPLFQANLPGEIGAPNPGPLDVQEHYGDAPHQDASDLKELRVASDATALHVLARTTTMRTATDTALLLLVDPQKGTPARAAPFNSGITSAARTAVLVTGDGHSSVVDMATGAATPLTGVTFTPDGWTNAIEADIPLSSLGLSSSGPAALAAATGPYNAATHAFATLKNGETGAPLGANLANVAFRFDEPIRIWFDKQQAAALLAKNIDKYAVSIDLQRLAAGGTDSWAPKPGGYFDRIFQSDPTIASESGEDGLWQHYGVWVPTAYNPSRLSPAMFWMHWRGGKAHSAATEVPRVMRDFGEERDAFVFSPFGRGDSTWYLGRGQADIREVWDDAMATFNVDRDRVYIGGHSMGGWAAWLFATTMPDRFAAAFPDEGPVTQGAYTGADFPGCDNYTYDEYSFCFVQANNGNARQEWTDKLLPNLRNVPVAVYQGVEDELVPVSGVVAQMNHVRDLGYRYRFYLFPAAEHYTHPILDEWEEAARYLFAQKRVADPAHVTYVRDMPFEQAVDNGPDLRPGHGAGLSFPLDSAYWMSELTARNATSGQAQFDGTSLAISEQPHLALPDAGGPASPGQFLPYVMTGQQWVADPTKQAPPTSNGFTASLTGASAVRLDMARMRVDVAKAVHGVVTTDGVLTVRLAGAWPATPVVTVDGAPVTATLAGGMLSISVPAGTHTVVVGG